MMHWQPLLLILVYTVISFNDNVIIEEYLPSKEANILTRDRFGHCQPNPYHCENTVQPVKNKLRVGGYDKDYLGNALLEFDLLSSHKSSPLKCELIFPQEHLKVKGIATVSLHLVNVTFDPDTVTWATAPPHGPLSKIIEILKHPNVDITEYCRHHQLRGALTLTLAEHGGLSYMEIPSKRTNNGTKLLITYPRFDSDLLDRSEPSQDEPKEIHLSDENQDAISLKTF